MYYVIVNRQSGKGMKVWNKVKKLLDTYQMNFEVTFIKSSSIEHQLKTMKDKIVQLKPKALVVIGGDGTIHYCLSILVESSIPLAVIPAGSGNDFARALHIPKSTKKAFQRVLNGNTKKIDVMSVNNELCVTVLGVGLDAMVANVVQNSQIKKVLNHVHLGRFAYILGLFKTILNYKPVNLVITTNTSKMSFEKVWLMAAGNMAYYGGGLKICPRADETSGKLDICIVHSLTKLQLLTLFPLAFFGKHTILKGVSLISASELTIQSERAIYSQADGEVLGYEDSLKNISILPSALTVIK